MLHVSISLGTLLAVWLFDVLAVCGRMQGVPIGYLYICLTFNETESPELCLLPGAHYICLPAEPSPHLIQVICSSAQCAR